MPALTAGIRAATTRDKPVQMEGSKWPLGAIWLFAYLLSDSGMNAATMNLLWETLSSKPPSRQSLKSVRKSLRKNEYETAEIYLVRHLVRPGNTVLDLGSGLGLTSIAAAKASGNGRVVGYEADPVIASLAENNVRRNGVRVEIRNKAIAKEKGVCEFYVHRSFPASSLFPFKGSKKILIEADAFQDVVIEIQPDVVIWDIEGI
jgi:FkbM family methyltransferase